MSIFQAVLLGLIYWISVFQPGYGNYTLLNEPLCLSFFVGIVMGDLPTAVVMGAAIQAMYLAPAGAGGTVSLDKAAATILPISYVISSNGVVTMEQGMVIAAAAGLLFAQIWTIRRILNGFLADLADRQAAKGNTRNIVLIGIALSAALVFVLFGVPMMLVAYLGSSVVTALMAALPEFVTNGLNAVGALLPAIGYAMIVYIIGRNELIVFFIAGFFFFYFTGLGSIQLMLVALFIGFLDMRYFHKVDMSSLTSPAGDSAEVENAFTLISKHDLFKSYGLFWLQIEGCNSFERLQALSYCVAMTPVIKKLYGSEDMKDQRIEALERHMQFFNTEGTWGSLIPGIVIALEEQIAMGKDIPSATVNSIKTGLMGPLAGIGDTLDWAVFSPLLLAFFIPYAANGAVWAGLVAGLLFTGITAVIGWYLCKMGYRLGGRAAVTLLQSNAMQEWMTFFSIVGLFMMGGLSAGMVVPQIAAVIPMADGGAIAVQEILDMICPGIFPLAVIMGIYYYMKRKGNILRATLIVIVLGVVLGGLGIIA